MKKTPNAIRVIATKIKGSLHEVKNIPCQDFYSYACSGNKLVAVVSDGAGSSKYGKIGAKIVAETLVNVLMNTAYKDVREGVKKAIEIARSRLVIHRLNKSKSEDEILNFSATVVGTFYHKNKGVFFHIGDGAGIALHPEGKGFNYTISAPCNGEFSCETYFYTMSNWEKNLRFTEIDKASSLILMTDGVTGFALNSDMTRLKCGFIEPINRYLNNEENKLRAVKALNNTLDTQKARKLNSDDKTFLWAGILDG